MGSLIMGTNEPKSVSHKTTAFSPHNVAVSTWTPLSFHSTSSDSFQMDLGLVRLRFGAVDFSTMASEHEVIYSFDCAAYVPPVDLCPHSLDQGPR